MKDKKRYNKFRLRELKKLSQNYENEKKLSQGYESHINGSVPVLKGHHRYDPGLMKLIEKIKYYAI